MLQVDKILVVSLKETSLLETLMGGRNAVNLMGRSVCLTVDCSDSEYRKDVAVNIIEIDGEKLSAAPIQMHIRRASVLFGLVDGRSSKEYNKNFALMLSFVTSAYNKKAPCNGPNVFVHFICANMDVEGLERFIEVAAKYCARRKVEYRFSVFGAVIDYMAASRSIEWLAEGSDLFSIYMENYAAKQRHWRNIRSVSSNFSLSHKACCRMSQDRLRWAGNVMVKQDDLFAVTKSLVNESYYDFFEYDFYTWLDVLDKTMSIRVYDITGDVFLEPEFYVKIVDHVLERLGGLSPTAKSEPVVFDINEVVTGAGAGDYLRRLPKQQQRYIVDALLTELNESDVARFGIYKGKKYVVSNYAVPSYYEEQQTILNMIAAFYERKLRQTRSHQLAFRMPGNIGALFIPVKHSDGLEIVTLYSTGKTEVSTYLHAIREPEKHKPIIREFLKSKPRVSALSLLLHGYYHIRQFWQMRSNIIVVSEVIKEISGTDNVYATWYCVDDIFKPVAIDFVERVRRTAREFAVRSASPAHEAANTTEPEGEILHCIRNAKVFCANYQWEVYDSE